MDISNHEISLRLLKMDISSRKMEREEEQLKISLRVLPTDLSNGQIRLLMLKTILQILGSSRLTLLSRIKTLAITIVCHSSEETICSSIMARMDRIATIIKDSRQQDPNLLITDGIILRLIMMTDL